MISDFVANTTRNCSGMLNIVKNLNVFSENCDKLIPLCNQVNESFEFYSEDSMKAIKNDLISIAMKETDWKHEQKKLKKSLSETEMDSKMKTHSENVKGGLKMFQTIILKKPKINKLENESILRMIDLKGIENQEKGNEFISFRKSFKNELKYFPKHITEFENELILQRNREVKNVMKLTKNLLKEHQRFAKASIEGKPFVKIEGIEYKESQKEFVRTNLKKLISIS